VVNAISRLWTTADNLTRDALLVAVASVVVNVGTFLGLSLRGEPGWFYLIHIALLILVLCTVISLVYVVLLTAVQLSTWGEGGAVERQGRHFWQRNGSVIRELTEAEYRSFSTAFLRVFSAGWLFFAVALATWNHNLLHRRRRLAGDSRMQSGG
jgi:hypothetical protein